MEEETEVEDNNEPQLSAAIVQGYHEWYHKFTDDYAVQKAKMEEQAGFAMDDLATQLCMMVFLGLEMTIKHHGRLNDVQIEQAFNNAANAFQDRYAKSYIPTSPETLN